jgi:hypothetical protein
MPSSSEHSVLFFRVYREAAIPLYGVLVDELCRSPHLPFQFATVLEDIGQAFIRFAEQANEALAERGLLDQEVEAESTVEARIEALVAQWADAGARGGAGLMLEADAVRAAVKIALVLTQGLPLAGVLDTRS